MTMEGSNNKDFTNESEDINHYNGGPNKGWNANKMNNIEQVYNDDILEIESSSTPINKNHGITVVGGIFKNTSFPVMIATIFGVIIGAFVAISCVISALHRIHEGHVGIYFKNGALLNEISEPGIHWSQPFVTQIIELQITPETKYLDPMVCTTKDGVRNVFRDVQVITSIDRKHVINLVREYSSYFKIILVYERITEAIQTFCAQHSIDEVYNSRFLEIHRFINKSIAESLERFAPKGLKVWNIFVPKPDVPPAIAANYRQVKVEWTQQLVAQQKQKTEKIKKETEKIKAVLDAERSKEVEMIDIEKRIQEEIGKRNITRINTQTWDEKLRTEADTSSYVQEQEASSNQLLLTEPYLRLQLTKALMNNTKLYFSGQDSLIAKLLNGFYPKNNIN